jgi:MFS family permease
MLIALPWMMTNRNASVANISLALGVFYGASLVSIGVSGLILPGRNTSQCLRVLMALLGITCAVTLYVNQPLLLIALRGFQGLLTGMLRPLNQIWLLQMADKSASHADKARQSAQSQVFIACGTILGAFLGGKVGSAVGANWVFALACGLPPMVGALLTPATDHVMQRAAGVSPGFGVVLSGLKTIASSPRLGMVVSIYTLNMAVFKLWTVAYPMAVRSDGGSLTPYLVAILTLSPVCFMFGQILMVRVSRLLHCDSNAARILVWSGLLQASLLPLALLLPAWLGSAVIICVIGGFAAAAIYPAMQRVIVQEVQAAVPLERHGVQIAVSAGADVGQILGALALAVSPSTAATAVMIIAIGVATALVSRRGSGFLRDSAADAAVPGLSLH